MVIRKLEKKNSVSIEEVINRGGNVLSDKSSKKEKEWTNFTLRIQKDLLDGIDRALENMVGISKTGWILQAIDEKLKKES